MQFTTWDGLFNLLLLVFWYRIWRDDDQAALFNPYLEPLSRFSDSAVTFLRPVFFGLKARWISAVAFLFLVLLRCASAPKTGGWILYLGFEIRQPAGGLMDRFVFSALSFAIFVFKLWAITLLYVRSHGGSPSLHTQAALHHLGRPFTLVRLAHRPLVLVGTGILLSFLLNLFGSLPSPMEVQKMHLPVSVLQSFAGQSAGQVTSRLFVSALAGCLDVIAVIIQFVILTIIGSWIAMFTGSSGIAFFCREWMDMLLGPLHKRPIRLGMLDLSPLIFVFILGAVELFLRSLLLGSYHGLL